MKVLIFGGAGFVGRHYTEHFLSKKYYVEIVDNIFIIWCSSPKDEII